MSQYRQPGGLQLTIAASAMEQRPVSLQGWALQQISWPEDQGQQRSVLILAPKRPISDQEIPTALASRRFPALIARRPHGLCLAIDLQYISKAQVLNNRPPRQWSKKTIDGLLAIRHSPEQLRAGQHYWIIDHWGRRQIVTITDVENNLITARPVENPSQAIKINIDPASSYWQAIEGREHA